jgi:hypothetical protein
MAKKREKAVKGLYEKNKELIMEVLADFLQRGGGSILDWIKRILSIKHKIRKVVASFGFMFAGLFVFTLGVSDYLSTFAPGLPEGGMRMIVGAIIIIISFLYLKN